MKIKRICIENFKSFHHAEIDFNGRNTIVFGVNGTGKSTLLSAVNYLARTWINRINSNQSREMEKFTDEDIFIGENELKIRGLFSLDENEYTLSRSYHLPLINDRSKQTTYNKKEYDVFSKMFSEKYLSENSENMPVYVFYGTNRSVLNIPNKPEDSRYDMLSALDRAIDSTVDFRKFFEWFRDCEAKETNMIRNRIAHGLTVSSDKMLDKVRFAIESVIENVSDLKVQYEPVRMTVKKEDKEIRVDMLSDGEKCTLALFGDLARRMCLANPKAEDPFSGQGIVLIDEIELHMHPTWQRKVMKKLTGLFPNVQFIVTTHSPQILGEADDNYLILAIDEDTREIIEISRLDGCDSNYILEEYMHTSSKNEATQNLIDEINKCIVKKEFENAAEKLSELKDIAGTENTDYILAKGFLERSRRLNA